MDYIDADSKLMLAYNAIEESFATTQTELDGLAAETKEASRRLRQLESQNVDEADEPLLDDIKKAKSAIDQTHLRASEAQKRLFRKFLQPLIEGEEAFPFISKIDKMLFTVDEQNRSVGMHVLGCLSSTVSLLRLREAEAVHAFFKMDAARLTPKQSEFAHELAEASLQLTSLVWGNNTGNNPRKTKALLRILALFHDVGKIIGNEHHISRSVHMLRDMKHDERKQLERLFPDAKQARNFLSVIGLHDIFGCLCTGEASEAALVNLTSWTTRELSDRTSADALAQLSLLLWLNLADANSTLREAFQGIPYTEAQRYFNDWKELRAYLQEDKNKKVTRDQFKTLLLRKASHPASTIHRIARIVASAYRRETGLPLEAEEVVGIVEEELVALHGPRFEIFCQLFAHFCKLDYAIRFFYALMRRVLLVEHSSRTDDSILRRKQNVALDVEPESDDVELSPFAEAQRGREPGDVDENFKELRDQALRAVVNFVGVITKRVVEEYGHLVDGDNRSTPLLGVNMSGLMKPASTGWSICESLLDSQSRAVNWIMDEVGIWLYGN